MPCERGSTAILFAVLSATILLTMGGTIDYMRLVSAKTKLQSIADAAAIVSARALTVAQTDEASIEGIAANYIAAYADDSISGVTVEASVDLASRRVVLNLAYEPVTFFETPFFGTTFHASSTAQVVGQAPLCVLTLHDSDKKTIDLNKNSLLSGVDCAVYANSKSSRAIEVDSGGHLSAALVCSAGGGRGDISPSLTKDCPALDDPLAGRATPEASVCDETDRAIGIEPGKFSTEDGIEKLIKGDTAGEESGGDKDRGKSDYDSDAPRETVVLQPGVYCGGLLIGGAYDVELEPGIYVIKDGPLFIDTGVRLTGTNVGFYFTGEGSSFYFASQTSIHLTAPIDGELAGLLFYQDPNNEVGQMFGILSDDARVLTGTIYLPVGELVVDSDKAIADQSAYTAIVARQLSLFTGPKLVLNSDYDETNVPAAIDIDYNKSVRLIN